MPLYEADTKGCAWGGLAVAVIALTTAATRSASIAAGRYLLYVDTPFYFRRGGSDMTAVVGTAPRMPAGVYWIEFGETAGNNAAGGNKYLSIGTITGTGTAVLVDPGDES